MTEAWGWTRDDVLALTLRQLRYYRSGGKPPTPGRRTFANQAEAQEWNERMNKAWDEYQWDSN